MKYWHFPLLVLLAVAPAAFGADGRYVPNGGAGATGARGGAVAAPARSLPAARTGVAPDTRRAAGNEGYGGSDAAGYDRGNGGGYDRPVRRGFDRRDREYDRGYGGRSGGTDREDEDGSYRRRHHDREDHYSERRHHEDDDEED